MERPVPRKSVSPFLKRDANQSLPTPKHWAVNAVCGGVSSSYETMLTWRGKKQQKRKQKKKKALPETEALEAGVGHATAPSG